MLAAKLDPPGKARRHWNLDHPEGGDGAVAQVRFRGQQLLLPGVAHQCAIELRQRPGDGGIAAHDGSEAFVGLEVAAIGAEVAGVPGARPRGGHAQHPGGARGSAAREPQLLGPVLNVLPRVRDHIRESEPDHRRTAVAGQAEVAYPRPEACSAAIEITDAAGAGAVVAAQVVQHQPAQRPLHAKRSLPKAGTAVRQAKCHGGGRLHRELAAVVGPVAGSPVTRAAIEVLRMQ